MSKALEARLRFLRRWRHGAWFRSPNMTIADRARVEKLTRDGLLVEHADFAMWQITPAGLEALGIAVEQAPDEQGGR